MKWVCDSYGGRGGLRCIQWFLYNSDGVEIGYLYKDNYETPEFIFIMGDQEIATCTKLLKEAKKIAELHVASNTN